MHCNLRLPNVAPVVLDFNYEAHNALVYQVSTNRAMPGGVIDEYKLFFLPVFRKAILTPLVLNSWMN